MAERKPNIGLVQIDLPRSEYEVKRMADDAVQKLAAYPGQASDFLNLLRDKLFLENVSGIGEREGLMGKFAAQVAVGVERYEWKRRRNDKLSVLDMASLIESLPVLVENEKEQKITDIDKISYGLVKGFVERRFVANADWRNQTQEEFTLVNAVADAGMNSGLYGKYLDLYLGKYHGLKVKGGMGWRSHFASARAIDPKDEKYFYVSSENGRSASVIAEILGRSDEIERRSDGYTELSIMFDVISAMFSDGMDPRLPSNRSFFEKLLRSTIEESNKQNNLYGRELSYDEVVKTKVPDEVWEVALQYQKFPERGEKLVKIRDHAEKIYELTGFEESFGDLNEFPNSLMTSVSPARKKIIEVSGKVLWREKIRRAAEAFSDSKKDWVVTTFSIGGIQGYVAGDPRKTGLDETFQPRAAARAVAEFLVKDNKIEKIRNDLQTVKPGSMVNFWDGRGYRVYLTGEGYASKSHEEGLLDLSVPEDLRSKSIEIFESNIKTRLAIPREFTQMPTRSGYLINLEEHKDLEGVFGDTLIKLGSEGGINVTLNIVNSTFLESTHRVKPIGITVTFPNNRTKVEFDDTGKDLPLDLQWISESVALNLVKHISCVPLNESEQQIVDIAIPEYAEPGRQSIPGRLGHVGGFRRSGDRKQYTAGAEAKFQAAMKSMRIATDGMSLAEKNRQHREEVPECDRWLTWYSGYEPDIAPPPVIRKAPDRIFSF